MNDALQNKFSKGAYSFVEALLLTWAKHDLDPLIDEETKELCSIFKDDYHFQAEHYQIPEVNPGSNVQLLLANKILGLENKSQDSRALLIFYYNGHGTRKHNKLIFTA